MIETLNPATGQPSRSYLEDSWPSIETALERAHRTYAEWRTTSFGLRARLLRELAAVLRQRREDYALLMANEMGKPVTQGLDEVEECARACEHFAINGARYLAPQPVETDARLSYVTFEPLGVVLAIMPWNFPFWQVFRFAAPNLMAGNVALLKHASNVPGCAIEIARCFTAAGFPDGAFSAPLVARGLVERIIAHPRVAAVTLTGGVAAGRSVARAAGEQLKKCVLELGGSDPYVVLSDADVEAAVDHCARSRLINTGQSCIAAKRFVVVQSLRARFEDLMVQKMSAAEIGDPLKPGTAVGPLARIDLRDDLDRQVRQSLEQGARLLCGGELPPWPGAWYPPTVLTGR